MGAHRQLKVVDPHFFVQQNSIAAGCEPLIHFAAELPPGLTTFCAQLCDGRDWSVVQLWLADDSGTLRCAQSWFAEDSLRDFCQISEVCSFAPGIDLPGETLNVGVPAWSEDLAADRRLPRAPVAELAGLHGGLALPLVKDGINIGVVELISREKRAFDDRTIEFLAAALQRALEGAWTPEWRKLA